MAIVEASKPKQKMVLAAANGDNNLENDHEVDDDDDDDHDEVTLDGINLKTPRYKYYGSHFHVVFGITHCIISTPYPPCLRSSLRFSNDQNHLSLAYS